MTDLAELGGRFTQKEGRRFGVTMSGAFLALAALLWWREHETLLRVAVVLAGAFLLAGVLFPGRLGPVWGAWMSLARTISRVTTPVIMGLLYFFVVTPAGILRRTFGRHPLRHSHRPGGFWVQRTDGGARADMHRQF